MSVKNVHCTALIQLLKRWMACSNILLNKSLARINKKIFLCAQSIQNSKISAQMMV